MTPPFDPWRLTVADYRDCLCDAEEPATPSQKHPVLSGLVAVVLGTLVLAATVNQVHAALKVFGWVGP